MSEAAAVGMSGLDCGERDYIPTPEVIEATCRAFQESWDDQQREAAWYGRSRPSSRLALRSERVQERLVRERAYHSQRRARLRMGRINVDPATLGITHYPDVVSDLKWEARFNKQLVVSGRRSTVCRRRAFATYEEAVAWKRTLLDEWNKQRAEARGVNE